MEQSLFFNILTFDWPEEPVTLYFSDTDNGMCQELYFTLFPNEVEKLFPNIVRNSTKKLYTTFGYAADGFKPLEINLKTDNPDFAKRYFNNQINYYFRKVADKIVRTGFVNENQIWLKSSSGSKSLYDVYEKFSLKVQIALVSNYPEIVLSYDGQSKICKQSAAALITTISPKHFNRVLHNKSIYKWEKCQENEFIDPENCFPVINKDLEAVLGIPVEAPSRENRYPIYLRYIQGFYSKYLKKEQFGRFIKLNDEGFLAVNPSRIDTTSEESNQLLFGNSQPDTTPKYALKNLKPFKKSPYPNIHLFFIVHSDDINHTFTIKDHFENGLASFEGMRSFVGLHFHTEEGFSIVFKDKDNPITEIEKELIKRSFDPEIRYIAIYVTPYGKFEKDKPKREIYYQLKELLLKRRITSQAIDPKKMVEQGLNWKYSLPNIAVAMLAKLDGIPWRLNTPIKNELVVGVGAFRHVDIGVQYIGSAFSFTNNGRFNRFEYFLRDEIDILAGSIGDAVKNYATVNASPDRLIIHFYKTMSENEMEPIIQQLTDLGLDIPVFIITINKTESQDIVAFDSSWNGLMPDSGTFIGIGRDKYLLFNNTRYNSGPVAKADGFPFPIKLKIQCSNPELTKDTKTVNELIDQVYQFSRMYWKSVRQQNLPVTIKYPEMVAQIAPHFIGNDIPPYGKDNLWFL